MTTEIKPAAAVKRLQHVVLQVSDVERSFAFYRDVLGYELTHKQANGNVFLRFPGSGNDHDLALFGKAGIGPADRSHAGLVHTAWEIHELTDLIPIRERLQAAGAFDHTSNHGQSLSVYGHDPDGLVFEFFWAVTDYDESAPREHTDFDAELAKRLAPAGH